MLRRNSFRAFLNTTSTMVSFLLSSVSKSLICKAATARNSYHHCIISAVQTLCVSPVHTFFMRKSFMLL